jgi:two-component system chemotaxis response regulator CheY
VSRTALVVDDSTSIRKLVGRTLVQAGFEVLEAANGQEGLDRLKDHTVQLVITDLNMPVMDGLDFIRELRTDQKQRFTPVVFLTTESTDTRKDQARDAGATAWIVKPFHPDKIMTVVNRLFPTP